MTRSGHERQTGRSADSLASPSTSSRPRPRRALRLPLLIAAALLLALAFIRPVWAADTKSPASQSAASPPSASASPSSSATAADPHHSSAATPNSPASVDKSSSDDRDIKYVVGLLRQAPTSLAPIAEGSRSVVMTGKNGRKFRCTIPASSTPSLLAPQLPEAPSGEATKGQKESSAAEAAGTKGEVTNSASASIVAASQKKEDAESALAWRASQLSKSVPALLRRVLGRGCFTKAVDFWSYEVCPFRSVRQYHQSGSGSSGTQEPQFKLGSYVAAGDSVKQYESMQEGQPAAPQLRHASYVQRFEGGSNNRASTVTFLCNSDPAALAASHVSSPNAHLLVSVREPKQHQYEFEVRTTLLCGDAEGRLLALAGDAAELRLVQEKEAEASKLASMPAAQGLAAASNAPGATLSGANSKGSSASSSAPSSETGRLKSAPASRVAADGSPHVLSLLEPLGERCLYLHSGWWSYKLCYLRELTQFHREHIVVAPQPHASAQANVRAAAGGSGNAAAAGGATATTATGATTGAPAASATVGASPAGPTVSKLVTTAEYSLGMLDPDLSVDQLESMTRVVKGDSWESSYVSQRYGGGTVCDLNNRPRLTEVRLYCDLGEEAPVLRSVVESATCEYVATVASRHLCAHPHFRPDVPKVHQISCEPLPEHVQSVKVEQVERQSDAKTLTITFQP